VVRSISECFSRKKFRQANVYAKVKKFTEKKIIYSFQLIVFFFWFLISWLFAPNNNAIKTWQPIDEWRVGMVTSLV
jgi:hypothetical protein